MNFFIPNLWLLALLICVVMVVCERVRVIKSRPILTGVILGLTSVVCSFNSFYISEIEIHICLRDAPISLGALFFGPWTGIVAGIVGVLGRVIIGGLEQTGFASGIPYGVSTLGIALYACLVRYFICGNKRPDAFFTTMFLIVGEMLTYAFLSLFISMFSVLDDLLAAFLPEVFFKVVCGVAAVKFLGKGDRICKEYARINNVVIACFIGLFAIVCYGMIGLSKVEVGNYMEGYLDILKRKNGNGVSVKLDSILRDLQAKEDIHNADDEVSSSRLALLAEKYGIQRLYICDQQGRLEGCIGDIQNQKKAFEDAWHGRFRELWKRNSTAGCESSFVKEGNGLGDDMTFAYRQLEDGSGYIIAGIEMHYYFQHADTLGLPEIWEGGSGRNGVPFIVSADTMTIEQVIGKFSDYLGREITFLKERPDTENTDSDELYFARVVGYYCYYKYFFTGKYYYFLVLPMSGIFMPCAIRIRLIALFLMTLCVFWRRNWLQRLRERQQKEEQQAAEAKRRKEVLALASTIQKSSLPNIFPPSQWDFDIDLFATMSPALEVGGDFYDYYYISPSRIAILVADVSGKGIPAAMFMMRAKSLIKSNVCANENLQDAMNTVNRMLSADNPAEMFVTCWVGILNKEDGYLEYVNAGHNPPYIRHADATITRLENVSGLFLAGMDDTEYRRFETRMNPGDVLFLYTDGVTEAVNATNAMFDESRLEASLIHFNPHSEACASSGIPAELCKTVGNAVEWFSAGAPQFDDITMLALYYRSRPQVASCTVLTNPQGQRELTDFLEKGLCEHGCSQDCIGELLIVLDEVVANVNTYSGSRELTLDMMYVDAPTGICMRFMDSGRPYNPLQAPVPDLTLNADSRPIGGLGLFIVKNTMDGLYYEYSNSKNVLTMLKYLNRQK